MTTNRIATLFSACGEPVFDQVIEALPRTKQQFRPGCRVRVQSGAMAGVEGTVLAYCSTSRLIIAVDASCQGVTLEVEEQKLAFLDA